MKKILAVLLLTIASLVGHAQSGQRIYTALMPIQGSTYAQLIPSASIYACVYNSSLSCVTPINIYSDKALQHLITQPLIADPKTAVYQYYIQSGTILVEKVCAPYNQCNSNAVFITGGVGGVSSIIEGTNITCTPLVGGKCQGDVTINSIGSTVDINGTPVSNPNFNLSAPSVDAGYTAATWKTDGSGNIIAEVPSGVGSPLTTKGDLYTYSTANTRLGVGSDGQALLADSGQTTGLRWGIPISSGVQYPDPNTAFVWMGDSSIASDTHGIANTITVTGISYSTTLGVTTVAFTNSGNNGLAALIAADGNAWVDTQGITSPAFLNTGNCITSSNMATTGVCIFPVNAANLSSTHFEVTYPSNQGSGTGTGGTAYTANSYLPIFVQNHEPYFKGHGSVFMKTMIVYLASQSSNFTTYFSAPAPVNTGHPAWLIMANDEDVYFNAFTGSCTAAAIEGYYQNVWSQAHALGYKIAVATTRAGTQNTAITGICSGATALWQTVQEWIRQQKWNPTEFGSSTAYIDALIDQWGSTGPSTGGPFQSNGNLTFAGIALVAPLYNDALVSQGDPSPNKAEAWIPDATGWDASLRSGGGIVAIGGDFSVDTTAHKVYIPSLGSSTSPLCTTTGGAITNSGCTSSSLSGMTGGQIPVAATATTVTSSKALGGTGAAIATGPTSSTANDIVTYADTSATQQDSGILITAIPAANIASGSLTNGMAATTQTGGDNTTKLATTAFVQAAIAAAGTGAGIVTYSGPSLTFTGTQYFPIGGGATSSTTETNVDIDSPAAVTIQNMTVQMSAAPGVGNSVVFTWRKNAAGTALTCTISGASATSCSDTTHNFSTAALDLLDIQAVTTGSIVGTPTVVMAAQVGIAATATTAFSAISGGTNTAAAMTVGSGASLGVGGTGTINATSVGGITITGTPSAGQVPTATSSSAATWQSPTNNSTPLFLHYVKVNQSGSVASITSPSITVTSGNLAVVGCRYAGSGAATGSVASGSSVTSWNLITTSATSTVGVQLSWGVITSSGSTTFTCTPSATSSGQSMVVMEFSGAGTTANNSSQGSSATLSSFGPFFTAGMTASTTSQRTLAVTCTSVALTTSFFVQPTWVNAINSSLVGFADDMGCYMTIIPFAIALGQGGQFTISSGSSVSNANSTVYMNY